MRVCIYIYINIKGILVILLTEKKIINDQCLEGNGLFFFKIKKKKKNFKLQNIYL